LGGKVYCLAAKEKLEIVLSAPVPAFTQEFRSGRQGEAGGRGVWGEFRHADLPAEVSTQAGPSQFRSDIFKQTPPNEQSEYRRNPKSGFESAIKKPHLNADFYFLGFYSPLAIRTIRHPFVIIVVF